jgi:hypothetical protein
MASAHELKTAKLGRMTESIAKELNECLCAIVINSSTCLRMLSANPPNVEGALETARRTIRSGNRAAEAVSRLSTLDYRKEVNGGVHSSQGKRVYAGSSKAQRFSQRLFEPLSKT